jgi:hypothetical protein
MSRSLFKSIFVLLVLIVTTGLDGASYSRSVARPRTDTSPVVFIAKDYEFAGPDRILAGVTTIQILNKGQDVHHIQLLKLLQGKTAADFRAAIAANPGRLPSWIKFVGGPNAIVPDSEAVATMNLVAGDYLLVCLIPDQKGVLHVALGMQKPLTVTSAKPTLVSEPKAGVTITQADFRFMMSQPIARGSHTIQVMNHGTQPHEVVVVKLAPGASVKDFAASVEPGASGPPQGKPVGGIVGLESGEHGFFRASFEPGNYGLICFFPDPTGQPHFVRGMTTEFTVK